MVYQLSYELKTLEKDYTSLYTFIEKELEGIHVLRDTWWIRRDVEVEISELCEDIREKIGENDIFFISLISIEDINGWLASSNWKWLEENAVNK